MWGPEATMLICGPDTPTTSSYSAGCAAQRPQPRQNYADRFDLSLTLGKQGGLLRRSGFAALTLVTCATSCDERR
jgi:hypothetical protein